MAPADSFAAAADLPPPALRQFLKQHVQPTPAEYALMQGRVAKRYVEKGALLCQADRVCEEVFFVMASIGHYFSGAGRGGGTS